MHLTLMREETLSSFAVRSLYVSGAVNINLRSAPLFMASNRQWKLFPMSDKELFKIYSGILETQNVKSVIQNHTLAPIYKLTAEGLNQHIEKYLTTADHRYKYSESLNPFSIKEVVSTNMKFCPLCFKEQVIEFGFTWFKREWQLHVMNRCLQHGCQLLSHCSCGKLFTNAWDIIDLMQDHCRECGSSTWIPKFSDKNTDFAKWLLNFFSYDLEQFSVSLMHFLHLECEKILGSQYQDILLSSYFEAELNDPNILDMLSTSSNKFTSPRTRIRILPGHIPYFFMLYPLSRAFPIFTDFMLFLTKVSFITHKRNRPEMELYPWYIQTELPRFYSVLSSF